MKFILIVVFTISLPCFAMEIDTLQIFDAEDSIVVVANRYQTSLKRVASNYQIVSAQDIQQLSTHSTMQLVDMQFPSAYVLEKKVIGYGVGREGAGSLNLRGLGGKPNTGVLVLLNGHPDFMGVFGHPLPDVYGTDNIQQMEILPGASSTVFGSNAMGGVINIVTRPDYSNLLRVSTEAGSYGTYNLGLQLNRQFGDHGGSFSFRTKHTDGHEPKTSFSSMNFQTDWQFRLNPVWSLSFSARYVPYEFDDPARENTDPANLGVYGKIERSTGEIILENKNEKLNGSTQIYANLGHHQFYDGFESNDFAYGLSTYQYWEYSKILQFAAGGDLMQYGGQGKNEILNNVDETKRIFKSMGVYLIGFISPIQLVQLRGGVRAQYHSENDWRMAPTAGISIYPASDWQIFANYQSGFRYPTMNELYLLPPANSNLVSEESDMYEFGLKYQYLFSNSIQLTVYKNDVRNLIQLVFPPPPKYQNSGFDKQTGVEVQLRNHWLSSINTMLSYGYLEVDHLTALNPKHQLKYMLNYSRERFSATLYGKYVQDLYANNDRTNPLADYNVLNFTASYKLHLFEIKLKLLNLLDRKYEYLPGYNAPGFHVLTGLNIGF